jgi:hypothetical protein
MKTICFSFFVLVNACFTVYSQDNQLKNAGFELDNEGWNYFGGTKNEVAKSGSFGLKVSQTIPNWSGAEQFLKLPKGANSVEVKGWIKTENVVPGKESWETARIAVEFLDENNAIAGGYPPVVGNVVGTADWAKFENTYDVPDDAFKVKVQVALANCAGTVYFDDVELYIKSESGENMKAAKTTGPSDWGSWYTIPVEITKSGSHYVDWSSLLDAPAGKHGYASAKDGKVVFADGTPARFWGVNLVAEKCFLEKKEADSLALRLSKMGCNLVRLHHMDAPWAKPNIFGNAANTLQLSKQSLDKVDYLISVLKKKGIYVFLDLLVHRDFMETDGVMSRPPDLGGKQVGFFDDRLISLQKSYITQLLNHKNPYTGLALKDEPAIIASEFINESSAFLHFQGDILTPEYKQVLTEKFNEDPNNEGKSLTSFDLDYSTFLSPSMRKRTNSSGDVESTMRFISGIEQKYYKTMTAHMRGLGVKYMLSGSNFPNPILACQKDNMMNDLLITNDYWDHPQIWKINNEWDRIEYAPFNNTSILKNPQIGPINNIAKYKWVGKPLIVTEFNVCYPNEYRLEGVPYLAAYGRLQGLDGLIQFNFDPEHTGANRRLAFATNNMPEHLAHWVVAAPLFLRGDVKEAPSQVIDNVTDKQIFSLPSYSDFIDKNDFLPLVTKVAKQEVPTEKTSDTEPFKKFYDSEKQIITSETQELTLNKKRWIFKINTPNIQGVVGALKDSIFNFPNSTISLQNPWASVVFVSKDNLPLVDSKHYYIVITTPVRTKGSQFTDGRNALKEIGEFVMQAQFAIGKITLKNANSNTKVYPVSLSGQRGAEVVLTEKSLNLFNQKSFVFEVVGK